MLAPPLMMLSASSSLGKVYLNLGDNWDLEKTSPSLGSMELELKYGVLLITSPFPGTKPSGAHGCCLTALEICAISVSIITHH